MRLRSITLVLLLVSAIGSAHAGAPLLVTDAWMRELPPVVPNAALYMTLENTAASEQRVMRVEADWAEKLELHESRQVDGMWQMQQLEAVVIGAGKQIELAPGGVHVMVFGVRRMPRSGERVTVRLVLEDNSSVEVMVEVRAEAPAKDGHHAHHH